MSEYPEHEKLAKVSDKSQAIGEFLDWMNEQGVFLAHYPTEDPDWAFPWREDTQTALARFYNIDRNKLEEEKRNMLDRQRELNSS